MVVSSPFGHVVGKPVTLLTLSSAAGVRVELLSLGAAVRSIIVPDRSGAPRDVALGYDTAEEYFTQDACFGGTVGRCANRIAGSSFSLRGKVYPLTANEGPNHLHGGGIGFHQKLWDFTCQENSVTFSRLSPHGEEGYPGNLRLQVTYTLQKQTLSIHYHAVTDHDTVVNLTNHTYFNLAGHGGGFIGGHVLAVYAGRYTPCGGGNLPTGALASVAATPLDLRQGSLLGDVLKASSLAKIRGLDHNFALDAPQISAAVLWCRHTGIGLEISTTLEGMQVYTAGFLTPRRGKAGVLYAPYDAVCLEPQHFPDAVHHRAFPSPVLLAGEKYRHSAQYRFFIKD